MSHQIANNASYRRSSPHQHRRLVSSDGDDDEGVAQRWHSRVEPVEQRQLQQQPESHGAAKQTPGDYSIAVRECLGYADEGEPCHDNDDCCPSKGLVCTGVRYTFYHLIRTRLCEAQLQLHISEKLIYKSSRQLRLGLSISTFECIFKSGVNISLYSALNKYLNYFLKHSKHYSTTQHNGQLCGPRAELLSSPSTVRR
jgi:hypothetical protein